MTTSLRFAQSIWISLEIGLTQRQFLGKTERTNTTCINLVRHDLLEGDQVHRFLLLLLVVFLIALLKQRYVFVDVTDEDIVSIE